MPKITWLYVTEKDLDLIDSRALSLLCHNVLPRAVTEMRHRVRRESREENPVTDQVSEISPGAVYCLS